MKTSTFIVLGFLGMVLAETGFAADRLPICQCNHYASLERAGEKPYRISLIDSSNMEEVLVSEKAYRSKAACHEEIYEMGLSEFCMVSYKVENRD